MKIGRWELIWCGWAACGCGIRFGREEWFVDRLVHVGPLLTVRWC